MTNKLIDDAFRDFAFELLKDGIRCMPRETRKLLYHVIRQEPELALRAAKETI